MVASSSNKSITTVASSGLSPVEDRHSRRRGAERRYFVRVQRRIRLQSDLRQVRRRSEVADQQQRCCLADRKSAGDGSRAGQLFNGQAWGGFSSKTWGTLSIGRHVTLFGDNTSKYDR
jgi:hypothetical protein